MDNNCFIAMILYCFGNVQKVLLTSVLAQTIIAPYNVHRLASNYVQQKDINNRLFTDELSFSAPIKSNMDPKSVKNTWCLFGSLMQGVND